MDRRAGQASQGNDGRPLVSKAGCRLASFGPLARDDSTFGKAVLRASQDRSQLAKLESAGLALGRKERPRRRKD